MQNSSSLWSNTKGIASIISRPKVTQPKAPVPASRMGYMDKAKELATQKAAPKPTQFVKPKMLTPSLVKPAPRTVRSPRILTNAQRQKVMTFRKASNVSRVKKAALRRSTI